MNEEQATALRRPFPPESVGKLPKGGVMLDYVGHAAVTDRLLSVDPEWGWQPLAYGEDGLPLLDKAGNLWIRLTVCGVTRIGVGDGQSAKEAIGDAIRNAAMRFGVALDLWARENLVEFAQAHASRPVQGPQTPEEAETGETVTPPQLKALGAAFTQAGVTDRAERLAYVSGVVGRDVTSSKELTRAEASRVLDALRVDASAHDAAGEVAP